MNTAHHYFKAIADDPRLQNVVFSALGPIVPYTDSLVAYSAYIPREKFPTLFDYRTLLAVTRTPNDDLAEMAYMHHYLEQYEPIVDTVNAYLKKAIEVWRIKINEIY